MILIAHRGLLDGPDQSIENHPQQIQACLDQHIDAEVDVWLQDNQLWLGHDAPQYKIDLAWLLNNGLWIHAKNDAAAFELLKLARSGYKLNFFWHENDQRTLTSQGFWWTFPGQTLDSLSVAVMPEWHHDDLITWSQLQTCYGICSDYVGKLKT